MKKMNINDRQVGKVTILDLEGNLRIGEGTVVLHNAIRRLIDERQTQVLLNLASVDNVDSSGLGELIAGHVALRRNGGQVKLLHLTKRVRELMTITKLVTVFETFEDESAALQSFKTSNVAVDEQASALTQAVSA